MRPSLFILTFLYLGAAFALYAGDNMNASCKSPSGPEEKIKSIWNQDLLTADWCGCRPDPDKDGVTLFGNYIGDTLAVVDGGVRRSITYSGLLELDVDLQSKPLLGYDGGRFHANAFWLHGGHPVLNTGALQPISSIEGFGTVRLFNFWYEQKFEGDLLAFRVGFIDPNAGDEFFVSQYANLFINGTYGWPNYLSANLPNGGPNFPVICPGLQLRAQPIDWISVMGAIFTGDPDSEHGNPHGTRLNFSSDQGLFAILETAFKINSEKDARGLPGTYKIGFWAHSGQFVDHRLDDNMLTLVDPASAPGPQHRWNNGGLYLVADQMVYRETDPKTCDCDRGLGLFARLSWAPANRNLIDFYADAGLNYKGLIPGRNNDIFGLAFAYQNISNSARILEDLDNDNDTDHTSQAAPDYEINVELTYQLVIAPWWSVQPDIQWIVHPGGSAAIPNATVIGVRTSLHF